MGWFGFGSNAAAAADAPAAPPAAPSAPPQAVPQEGAPPPSAPPRAATKTGTRTINASAMDSTNINIINAKRVDTRTLLYTGDSVDIRHKKQEDAETGADKIVYAPDSKRCNYCCMAYGAAMSGALSMFLAVGQTGLFAYREQHRVNITVAKFCRHAAWMMIPPTMVGASLHFFLSESFWSKRKNTFGMAWAKAIVMNTAAWTTAIGVGTLFWRHGLRLTKFGSKLYYRYPAAAESLELRLVENPRAGWTGMTWTYWAIGLVGGQAGYCACVGVVVAQNRVHTLMSPAGGYSAACSPWWRREQIAANAGMVLKKESERPTAASINAKAA